MCFEEIHCTRIYVAFLVEFLEKNSLIRTGRIRDTFFFEAVAVDFRVDDLEVRVPIF